MKLLIVNDEIIAARGTKSGIDWENYGINEVDVAFDAEMARELMEGKKFDILLCDIEMPGESGIELVRWVREKEMDIEVIFLTCHADFEFAQEAIRLQCRNYVLVPAAYDEIAKCVYEAVLEIKKRREERKHQIYGQLWIGEREKENDLKAMAHSPEKTVEKVEEYIGKYLNDRELSVNKIAAQMYLSPDHLNRIFKKRKGVSIGHYITERRMEMAADMLREGRMGASIIAELVGYNSYSSFVTAFKNYHGCSPSKFLEG